MMNIITAKRGHLTSSVKVTQAPRNKGKWTSPLT